MTIFIRYITVVILSVFCFIGSAFADDDNNVENTNIEVKTEVKKWTIQKSVNAYILDIYKFQWDRILKDLDENLTKIFPTTASKVEAYKSIQDTLEKRKWAIESDVKIGKNSKIIITKYLNYMIDEIEKKKEKAL